MNDKMVDKTQAFSAQAKSSFIDQSAKANTYKRQSDRLNIRNTVMSIVESTDQFFLKKWQTTIATRKHSESATSARPPS